MDRWNRIDLVVEIVWAQRARVENVARRTTRQAADSRKWNLLPGADAIAAMFSGGPAQPSPTIAMAIGSGFTALVVKCSRCNRETLVDLATIERPPSTFLWKLEASLNCQPCRIETGSRRQAYIIGLRCTDPDDPNAPVAAAKGEGSRPLYTRKHFVGLFEDVR